MLQIILLIAPIFLIIFGSAIIQHYNKLGDEWSLVLNKYALNIGFPALIFSAMTKKELSLIANLDLILINSVLVILIFLFVYLFYKIFCCNDKLFRTLFICFSLGNIAYLGIPILNQNFGPTILQTASLIVATYLFWIFTVGILFIEFSIGGKKFGIKKIFLSLIKNPLLIAVLLGVIIALLKIKLPGIILNAVEMISLSATPLVLVAIGLFIGKSGLSKINNSGFVILGFSFFKLILIPFLFYLSLKYFGFSIQYFSSSIIEAMMPLAITPFALADNLDLDKKIIAQLIVFSTIISCITIPIGIYFLN